MSTLKVGEFVRQERQQRHMHGGSGTIHDESHCKNIKLLLRQYE